LLFANQGGENVGSFTDKRLKAFAESLGLDMNKFNQCFNSDKYASDIDSDVQKASTYGINSTPTVIVNGKNISPSVVPSYEVIKAAIDAAFAGGG
jgi:protein-disulfide isomerase